MLYSSIWVKGTKEDKLVWVTILMMKDKDGLVYSSVPGLARMAGVTDLECKECLDKFLNPDPDDSSKVEEGRKLREVPGGWQVVNHDLYRFSTEEKREFWRKQKAEQREAAAAGKRKKKTKVPRNVPTYGEKMEDQKAREEDRPQKFAEAREPEGL